MQTKNAQSTNTVNIQSPTLSYVDSIVQQSSSFFKSLQKQYGGNEKSSAFIAHEGEWRRAAIAFVICLVFHYSIEPFIVKQWTHLSVFSFLFLFIETIALPLVLLEVFQSIGTDRLHLHHSTLGLVFNWVSMHNTHEYLIKSSRQRTYVASCFVSSAVMATHSILVRFKDFI